MGEGASGGGGGGGGGGAVAVPRAAAVAGVCGEKRDPRRPGADGAAAGGAQGAAGLSPCGDLAVFSAVEFAVADGADARLEAQAFAAVALRAGGGDRAVGDVRIGADE